MHISIQATGFDMTQALQSYTERRLRSGLGWARTHLSRLTVAMGDINGPRGGIDKQCQILLKLDGGGQVVVHDTKANLYAAIDRAIDRANCALVRQLQRKRNFVRAKIVPPASDVDHSE